MIDVGTGPWPYRGVTSEVTALMTVVREIPNGDAILSFWHALSGMLPDQRPVPQRNHTPIAECSLFKRLTDQLSSDVTSCRGRRVY